MAGGDPNAAPSNGKPRLLVVEDDAPLLAALTFDLEAEGYAVAAFSDADRVLASLPDADCMIVDLALPGMDGLALIDRLRALGADAPAVLITTDPDRRCRQRASAVRAEIVEKPLIGRTLQDRIAALLQR